MSSGISINNEQSSLIEKGKSPFKIDNDLYQKLTEAIKQVEFVPLRNLSEDKYNKIKEICPKIDEVDKGIIAKIAISMISFVDFQRFQVNQEKDTVDLKNPEDIFCTNGEVFSTLNDFPGINMLAYECKIAPSLYLGEKKIEIIDKKIRDVDRFILQVFGKSQIPNGMINELEKQVYKWYKEVSENKSIDLNQLNVNVLGTVAKNYMRTVKFFIAKKGHILKDYAVKALKDVKLKRFIFNKLEEDGIKVFPVKRVNFSINSNIKIELKKSLDLDILEKVQEKASSLEDYEKAKAIFNNLQKILDKRITLVKSLLKRSLFHNIVENKKVKKTRDDQLIDKDIPSSTELGIRVCALPFEDKFISKAISCIRIKRGKVITDEEALKELPNNIAKAICRIFQIEDVKSQIENAPEILFPTEEAESLINNNI